MFPDPVADKIISRDTELDAWKDEKGLRNTHFSSRRSEWAAGERKQWARLRLCLCLTQKLRAKCK